MSADIFPQHPICYWAPFDLKTFLEEHEGKTWQHEDTLRVLARAEEVDALIEQLMRCAGVEIVE